MNLLLCFCGNKIFANGGGVETSQYDHRGCGDLTDHQETGYDYIRLIMDKVTPLYRSVLINYLHLSGELFCRWLFFGRRLEQGNCPGQCGWKTGWSQRNSTS